MSVTGYALLVGSVLVVSLGTLFLLPASRLDPAGRNAAVMGALLAAANTLLAYSLAVWSEQRSTQVFFRAVLGGMGVRMGLVLGAVVAAVLALRLPSLPLVISLLGHFSLFLVLELALLHRRTSHRP